MTGFGGSFKLNVPTGVIGKSFLSLFFLFFVGMGLMFVGLIARDTFAGIRVWTWQKASCEMISSGVDESGAGGRPGETFLVDVKYRYTFGGRSFVSNQYKRSAKGFSDYGKAARLAERYHPGSKGICYVNPSGPQEAVLERDNLFAFLLVLFPMIFVVIGAGGLYLTWRSQPARKLIAPPISERANMGKGRGFLGVFFSVFLLAGSGFFYGFFVRPVIKIVGAKGWPVVPCEVISSEVVSHSGEDGSTYSVNILYRYEYNDREFKANRYDFMGGSSSGYSGKQAIVARHAPGTKTVCYVNPRDPTDAVLERGFTSMMWIGLIPLVFVVVGAGGLVFTLRKPRSAALAGAMTGKGLTFSRFTVPAVGPGKTNDTIDLKPKTPAWARLLAVTGAAIFWNGVVSVFLVHVVNSWRSGRGEWFLTLFLTPFVLIGLGLVVAIFYSLLALFNPRPRLRITPGAVPLAGTLRVEWELTGRTEVLRTLSLRLQGREEATYRRGTNTTTDKNVFADLEIAEISATPEMRSGSGTVTIPAHLMHSFESQHNKIIWLIRLHGEIARWPDVNEEFPVTVLPAKPAAVGEL